ncbi:MAG: LysE family translocator [Rhodobacteraceae bacterium]|nr:LysE family translocator [Paracoccaceae bacterium]
MPIDALISLIGIAMAAAWSPGPNNALVASSGARFGFRRTFPHVAGIGIGFPVMIFCIAIGLGQLFQQSTLLREILRFGGIFVLLFVAWQIANSAGKATKKQSGKPFSFLKGAAFQWVNPKAWVMAIGISAQYVKPDALFSTALIVASVFLIVGFGSASSWTAFGAGMQRWLNTDNRLRIFNVTMAGLIVLSVLFIASAELA